MVVVLPGETWLASSLGSTLLAAVVGAFLVLILRRIAQGRRPRSSSPRPLTPGKGGLPFVGETLDFFRCMRENRVNDFFEERKVKHGGIEVFRTSLFFHKMVVFAGPKASRFLYSSEGKLVRETWPRFIVKLLGDNTLVVQSGQHHRRLRRLAMTCLCPEALQKFVAKVDLLTQEHLAQHWQPKALQTPPNNTLVLHSLVKSHALDVANVLLVGVEDQATRDQLASLFITFVSGFRNLPIYLPGTRYYRAHSARAKLIKLLDDLISVRKREIEASQPQSAALVSTLITARDEHGANALTQREIQDLLIVLLFAGHDTSASTISLVCKFLVENPACYEQVLKEQTEIAESKQHGEALSWGDVLRMKYTWSVVQETLRLQPVVFCSFKVALEDFEYEGFNIPRGWKIMHNLASSNLDEKCFPDPKTFNPSRFMQPRLAPYTFLPFGGGSHICPGIDFTRMSVLVLFHHLVRKFKWTLVDPCEHISINPVPVPVNGLRIRVEEMTPETPKKFEL